MLRLTASALFRACRAGDAAGGAARRIFRPVRNRWFTDAAAVHSVQSSASSSSPSPSASASPLYTLSFVQGRTDVPLLNETLAQHFERQTLQFGDKEVVCVRHQQVRLSWNELWYRAKAMARGLLRLGYRRGDRLGVWMPNNAEWVVSHWATSLCGIILVNVNPAYRVHELEHALRLVGCRGVVLTPVFKQSRYLDMLRSLRAEIFTRGGAPLPLEHVFVVPAQPGAALPELRDCGPDYMPFDDLLNSPHGPDSELESRMRSLDPHDPINIQFTSGTTGLPKGATLTHHNIVNNGFFVGETLRLTPRDKLCVPVPLYHCFGLVLGNLAAMTHGASVVYPSAGFDAEATLQAVHDERCTGLHGVPTMFIQELSHPRFHSFDLTCLRTGIMAGSLCPAEIMRRCMTEMHMKDVSICYGMTETSPVSFQTSVDDPVWARVETVGRVHPHVTCKVVPANGSSTDPVPVDTPGELLTKGYVVMKGYWGDHARTAIDSDGFMHTGDLATIDAQGYCRIVGRIKDMIIRGGENIYPKEIEEFLYRHPDVMDVSVIGVPDSVYGERVCAWVIPKPGRHVTLASIRAFCRDRLAHYKVPEYLFEVSEFPLTVTGKIQKFEMRRRSVAWVAAGKGTV